MKADLHCHTRISDNSFTIREVIEQAQASGIAWLAITDTTRQKGCRRR